MNEQYYFFWNGPLSQWYSSPFTDNSGIKYCTAEQYMMYQKAIIFDDDYIAKQILKTSNPKEQKALGRKVSNFDASVWNKVAQHVVYEGNYFKFTQNPKLLKFLLDIDNEVFVEASPYDRIWGIGMNETQAKITPANEWNGTNWLGLVLTKLRNNLREQ